MKKVREEWGRMEKEWKKMKKVREGWGRMGEEEKGKRRMGKNGRR